jgi:hypothetical protein
MRRRKARSAVNAQKSASGKATSRKIENHTIGNSKLRMKNEKYLLAFIYTKNKFNFSSSAYIVEELRRNYIDEKCKNRILHEC